MAQGKKTLGRRSIVKSLSTAVGLGATISFSASDAAAEEAGPEDVYLGQDTTISNPKYGNTETETTGFQAEEISDCDADYNLDYDEAYAEVGNHSGAGSLTAQASLGYSIEIADDSGQQDATITYYGDIFGTMNLEDASNYVRAKLIVKDQNDDEEYDSNMYEKTDYVGTVDESLTESIVVPLEAGHYYNLEAEVLTEITVTEGGDYAISDIHNDGTGDGFMEWDKIEIDF